MPARRFFLFVALVTTGARSASAQDELRSPARHRLGADLGLASALGLVGVDYQFAPAPWMRLEAATGWGPTGAQFSMMPKIALGGGTCAFTAGVGASLAIGGQQAAAGHGPDPDVIPWLNVDLPGVECRSPSGLSVQATLGLTMPLVDFHWDLADVGDTVKAGTILPQGRAGIGWWF